MESHVATGGAIVLVGFMGAGKSTGARSLAAELGGQAVDSDRELEQRIGEPIESFFDREGEAAFRLREEEVVCELLGREGVPVIALGGGAVQSERVRDALTRHTVVHLEIEPGDAWRRASGKGRPLARDPERFEALWRDRRGLYEAVSDVVVPPSDRDALRRALPFVRAMAEAPSGTRLVWAAAESGAYPVFVGRGLIAAGFFPPLRGRRFVVTDENVARLQRVDGDERIVVIAGEEHKTIHGSSSCCARSPRAGAERGRPGRGGRRRCRGRPGRLLRGRLPARDAPCSGADDAGGAGRFRLRRQDRRRPAGGQELRGRLPPASAVLCDPAALDTLPAEEAAAGYAEVVKTALIAGGSLWARVRQGGQVGVAEIMGCLRTKLAWSPRTSATAAGARCSTSVTPSGTRSRPPRATSAIATGRRSAVGLLAALRLSDREALRAEVAELLSARGLPLRFAGASVDDVLALVERDKKRSEGRVPFVLVEAPGEVTPGHDVDPAALRAAVEEVHEA